MITIDLSKVVFVQNYFEGNGFGMFKVYFQDYYLWFRWDYNDARSRLDQKSKIQKVCQDLINAKSSGSSVFDIDGYDMGGISSIPAYKEFLK